MTTIYIVLLLVANGFFVAAEFALVKVPLIRLESLANEGGAAARMTVRIAQNLEAYLATCQLGITMASLGLGWIGEPAVAAILEPAFAEFGLGDDARHLVAFLLGFIIFSSLHIVVGEQVPKTYAIRRADKVALWIAYPLHWSYMISYPLTRLLNAASSATLRLLGVEEVSHAEVLTGAELRDLIGVSQEHGELRQEQAQMMQNVFTFHDRPLARIMLPTQFIASIDRNMSRDEIINLLSDCRHSRLAVIDGSWSNFLGWVLVKELLLRLLNDKVEQPLVSHSDLIREPQLVPASQPVSKLFEKMQASRQHIAFAIDEYSEVVGLITIEDLLEEIVGEIADESDDTDSHAMIRESGDGWQCEGLTLLSDLERTIGFDIDPSLNANTVTGLFMQRLLTMPKVADVLEEGGFKFEITKMRGRHPITVDIGKLAIPPSEDGATEAN